MMIKKILSITAVLFYANLSLAGGSDGTEIYNNYKPKRTYEKKRKPINNDIYRLDSINESASSPKCETTPSMKHANKKNGLAKPTNNLYKKTGYPESADGELILVKGVIYDIDCVPISNAMVQIWQADSNGNYLSSYNFDNAWKDVSEEYDPNFGYSGAVQTNNSGEFSFVTVKPGSKKWGIVPSIDLRVEHEFHGKIDTRIFFDDVNNAKDRYLKKLKSKYVNKLIASKSSYNGIKQYSMPVIYNGIDQYRKY